MISSQVLYAQWEKQSIIEDIIDDIIDDILNPSTGDSIIRLLAVFVVSISILASTVYYIRRRWLSPLVCKHLRLPYFRIEH